MTTTFEKYDDPGVTKFRNGGHSWKHPSEDVEILNPPKRCECGTLMRTEKDSYGYDRSTHDPVEGCPYPRLRGRCRYCGTDDPTHLTFEMQSYSDHSACSRCGGENDFGIGD